MGETRKLSSPYLLAQAGIVRNRASSASEVCAALQRLGEGIAQQIVTDFRLQSVVVTTPMNEEVEILTIDDRVSVVVTTKPDLKEFGHAIADVLAPCELGYMSFQGRRGLDALTGPVREMELPDLGGEKVSLLVIAKSTLATGCTAVSLTQTAVRQYSPNAVVIASIFHSVRGLQELTREFPGANIYVVGDPDRLGVDGMLYPGVGMLELRMTALE